MKMKTAIVLFLYAARSLAEDPIDDCSGGDLQLDCATTGKVSLSAPLSVVRKTSTGVHGPEPTTISKVDANRFISPDGSKIFDVNSSIDVHWTTDATDCSIQLNCTLDATKEPFTSQGTKPQVVGHGPQHNHTIGSQFPLPSKSATCTLSMLDAKGKRLVESAAFHVRDTGDAVKSSTARGDLPTSSATSDTAMSLSLIFTNTANSNATLTASSANSTSTSASSPLPSSVPSTTAPSIMSSTVPTTIATKTSSSGSNPIARVQAVVGIVAGAAALVLLQWLS